MLFVLLLFFFFLPVIDGKVARNKSERESLVYCKHYRANMLMYDHFYFVVIINILQILWGVCKFMTATFSL